MATSSKKRHRADDRRSPDLSSEDVKSLAETLSKDHLVVLLWHAALRHSDVLRQVVGSTEKNRELRKIFVRGLGTGTQSAALREAYSKYGLIEEAVVISDSKMQQGRGYGFVIYTLAESAQRALKNPSNMVDGRLTVCHSAEAVKPQIIRTKIYISNIPDEITNEKLINFFSQYGEIIEGPFAFKKGTSHKSALIVYKTPEAAMKALEEPIKTVDGHTLRCKLADPGSKPKVISDFVKEPPADVHPSLLNPLHGQPEGLPLSHIAIDSSVLLPEVASNKQGLANTSKKPMDLPNSGLGPNNPALAALRASLNSTLAANLQSKLPNNVAQNLGSVNSTLAANLQSKLPNNVAQNLGSVNSTLATNLQSKLPNNVAQNLGLVNSTLAANLQSKLPNSVAQNLGSEESQALPGAIASVRLGSLGAQSGGVGAYPAQLAAYPNLVGTSLHNVGIGSTSHVGAAPGSALSSFPSVHLATTLEERARIAEAIGRLGSYYGH